MNVYVDIDGVLLANEEKATPEQIEHFAELQTDDIKVEAAELLRHQKPLKKSGQKKTKGKRVSPVSTRSKRQSLDSLDEAMQQSSGVSQHGFSYGKKIHIAVRKVSIGPIQTLRRKNIDA